MVRRVGLKRVAVILIATLILASGWGIWSHYGSRPVPPDLAVQAERVDHILIEKSARRLTARRDGQVVLEFDIALGFAPEGDKQQEGDGKTPEGLFKIDRRNPNSSFYLSLGLNYPRPRDVARASEAGLSPGGDIFIHGQPNALGQALVLPGDWTEGCIAVTNSQMERLWHLAGLGTRVEIRP